MEADWQEVYGLDLADAMYGKEGGGSMSARRVVSLTLNLPQESRTMAVVGGDGAVWSHDRVLLGMIAERIDSLHTSFIRANGGKPRKPQSIVPRPKPGNHRGPVERATALGIMDDVDALVGGEV